MSGRDAVFELIYEKLKSIAGRRLSVPLIEKGLSPQSPERVQAQRLQNLLARR